MKRHVVLIGLPGSGKTTVGGLVAGELHATFWDVDALIVQDTGMSVAQVFAERGEPAFRALERAQVESLLEKSPGVIAPGGGWAAQPGSLESVRGRALSVYLVASPEVALRRASAEGGRPMLEVADPLARMKDLFERRRVSYQQADAAVSTDGRTPEEVASVVVALARSNGGW